MNWIIVLVQVLFHLRIDGPTFSWKARKPPDIQRNILPNILPSNRQIRNNAVNIILDSIAKINFLVLILLILYNAKHYMSI